MSGHRKALRDAVRAALQLDAQLGAMNVRKTWSQNVDEKELPAWGVSTPSDPAELFDAEDLEYQTQVAVMLRRAGHDDLEDELDDDADRIVAAAMPALDAAAFLTTGIDTKFDYAGEGSKRVGQVTVSFLCRVQAPIPGV